MHKDIPLFLEDYYDYIRVIKGLSESTCDEYILDLKIFLRFLKIRYRLVGEEIEFEKIVIADLDELFLKKISLKDLHAYIAYVDKKRGNQSRAKYRKTSALRSFFWYLTKIAEVLKENPTEKLESPKLETRNPSYLTLSEAQNLLKTVESEKNEFFRKRDFCILSLFLNCGIRLSELRSIDVSMIRDDGTLSVIGKGNKERTIYLNEACIEAIKDYLSVRPTPKDISSGDPLFISTHKKRLERRSIERLVDKYISKSGLDPSIYSTHKLRHTAATLMYKYGNVDIRSLQEILGHSSVATTQIYTHVDSEKLREAVASNPLSSERDKNSGT